MTQFTENDAPRYSHPIHGEGTLSTLSLCGRYAVIRYPAGYLRTHALVTLTRVIPPEKTSRS